MDELRPTESAAVSDHQTKMIVTWTDRLAADPPPPLPVTLAELERRRTVDDYRPAWLAARASQLEALA